MLGPKRVWVKAFSDYQGIGFRLVRVRTPAAGGEQVAGPPIVA